jgi:hypothetical protein
MDGRKVRNEENVSHCVSIAHKNYSNMNQNPFYISVYTMYICSLMEDRTRKFLKWKDLPPPPPF